MIVFVGLEAHKAVIMVLVAVFKLIYTKKSRTLFLLNCAICSALFFFCKVFLCFRKIASERSSFLCSYRVYINLNAANRKRLLMKYVEQSVLFKFRIYLDDNIYIRAFVFNSSAAGACHSYVHNVRFDIVSFEYAFSVFFNRFFNILDTITVNIMKPLFCFLPKCGYLYVFVFFPKIVQIAVKKLLIWHIFGITFKISVG